MPPILEGHDALVKQIFQDPDLSQQPRMRGIIQGTQLDLGGNDGMCKEWAFQLQSF